jgi:hypothetical protein
MRCLFQCKMAEGPAILARSRPDPSRIPARWPVIRRSGRILAGIRRYSRRSCRSGQILASLAGIWHGIPGIQQHLLDVAGF